MIEATVAQALARLQQWFDDPAKRLPPPVEIVDDYDVVFGQRYDRGAVLPEGPVPKTPPFEPFETLSGKPGTRAPHLKLRHNGQEISTLDLFGGGFVLLAGPQGDAWCEAAADADRDITCYRMGRDLTDVEGKWRERYGVRDTGAVLVRPDGFVAWRTEGAGETAEVALEGAWTRVLTGSEYQRS